MPDREDGGIIHHDTQLGTIRPMKLMASTMLSADDADDADGADDDDDDERICFNVA